MFRLLISALLALLANVPAGAAEFRAAAVKLDITPADSQWLLGYDARRSTGVHDKIFHRIVVLDDGHLKFVLISSEFCLFSPGLRDETAATIERETGIPSGHVWWTVTHTHSAPELGPPGVYKTLLGRSDHEWNREYAAWTTRQLLDGVRRAIGSLEPARLAVGTGTASANINRRARDANGVTLGLNPDGPVDRQIGLIRLERADGSLIALIVNYAMHGTVLGGSYLKISGDAPGIVSDYLESKLGAPVLYINGAAGNLAPIYSVYPNPESGHLKQFQVLLGDHILDANSRLHATDGEVHLRTGEKFIVVPRRPGLEWPQELGAYAVKASDGTDSVRLPLRFLRLNDLAIWSAPVEMFCDIAVSVRQQSPFQQTFYFGYANGWLGYLPTAQAFDEGGYEPKTSVFTPAAERAVRDGALAGLAALR